MTESLDYLLYDENDILERVDEYSLYCRYLGYVPMIGGKYRSPLRPGDEDPSFGMYIRKHGTGSHEYLWKDQALGVHGNIFNLVEYLYRLTDWQARQQICADFNLGGLQQGFSKIINHEPRSLPDIHIEIKSRAFTQRELDYWQRINVTPATLKLYNITAFEAYWLTKYQTVPNFPSGLAFAYRIWDKYQLYFPYAEKVKKFRNDWTEKCVPGFLQLKYTSDTLVVTKAMKDVAMLHSFGYEAIAPRGENILLPEACIKYIQTKYTNIVTLFDNDGKHKAAEYPFRETHIPLDSGEKDPTDFCARYGPTRTAELLAQIIHP